MASKTVNPPVPESKTPMGNAFLGLFVFWALTKILIVSKNRKGNKRIFIVNICNAKLT